MELLPGELVRFIYTDEYGPTLLTILRDRRQYQLEKIAYSLDPLDKGALKMLDEIINAFERVPQIDTEE